MLRADLVEKAQFFADNWPLTDQLYRTNRFGAERVPYGPASPDAPGTPAG